MIKCRACLKTEENLKMYPLNDKIIVYFNLLTEINVKLNDSMPQQICECCLDIVNLFIEFRAKCILSNSILLDNNIQNIKEENRESKTDNDSIKQEKSELHNSDGVHSDVDDNFIYELVLNEKQFEGASNDKLEGLCIKEFKERNSLVEHLDIHKINGDNICDLCMQNFSDWQELFSHRLIHLSNKNDKVCHICFTKFVSPAFLEYHYKKQHLNKENPILRCCSCKQSYTTPQELQEHKARCHGEESLICNCCSKIFTNEKQLKQHVTKHTERKTVEDVIENSSKNIGNLETNHKVSNEQKEKDLNAKKSKNIKKMETRLLCGLCENIYESLDSLLEHLDSHKKNSDNTCRVCAQTFTNWTQLFSHRLQHLPTKQKACHICFKGFRSHVYLEHHYNKIHCNNEKAMVNCLTCNKSYNTPIKLRKHVWRSHSNKTFICDFCSRTYCQKDQLRKHIKGHMGRESLECDQCDYSTKYITNLKEHKIRKHTPKRVYCKVCSRVFSDQLKLDAHKCNVRSLICSTCGKTFKGNKQLTRHMASHESVGRFQCARCPARYRSRSALRAHRDRHDGVRARRCPHCPAAFYSFSVLTKHKRTHTGIKPYVCKICQKAFTGNNNLKVHMRVHGEYLITKRVTNK
ncbi:unnamed protein product, partial [Brenthis ino]